MSKGPATAVYDRDASTTRVAGVGRAHRIAHGLAIGC